MKVGGYSNSRGITFYNKILKVNSFYRNGEIINEVEWIITPKWFSRLEKIPILGGIVMLYYQWKIFSKKMKFIYIFLLLLIIVDNRLNFSYKYINDKWVYVILALLLLINFRTIMRVFRFHGAEHKVINCFTENGYVSYDIAKITSRFNKRCGSNLVLIFLILFSIMWALGQESLWVIGFLMLITIQIMKILNKKDTRFDRYINIVQYITVQEPKYEELGLATQAFNKLLQATLIYQRECNMRAR